MIKITIEDNGRKETFKCDDYVLFRNEGKNQLKMSTNIFDMLKVSLMIYPFVQNMMENFE